MKLLLQSIFFAYFFLVVPFIGAESSPPPPPPSWNDNFTSNITRGSSLSTSPNDTSYWLSPSGNIAFGFYKLPCSRRSSSCSDRYVVGIWFVKSSKKTLVWTANRNNLPLSKPSSVLLTSQGKLVLRVPDKKDIPLIHDLEPVSYAKIHDSGNFVLYDSNYQIIGESFDYPTDTILGGQKLKDGVDLVCSVSNRFDPSPGEYKLSIRPNDGLVVIRKNFHDKYPQVIPNGFEGSILMSPVTLNLDSNTGNLFLVGSDGVVLAKLYEYKNQQPTQHQQEQGIHIYRATLDSKGGFNLFKERIDGNVSALVPLWSSLKNETLLYHISFGVLCVVGALFAWVVCSLWLDRMKEKIENWKTSHASELELGKN